MGIDFAGTDGIVIDRAKPDQRCAKPAMCVVGANVNATDKKGRTSLHWATI
jgi:ankyrin repeat protein